MSREIRPAIVVVGDVALDRTLDVDPTTAADEKRTVRASTVGLGGTGANIAAQAARLGAEVELASVVGDDDRGAEILGRLGGAGVGVRLVRVISGTSTFATVVLDEPRRVYVEPGVAEGIDVDAGALQHAALVVVSYAPALVPRLVAAGLGNRLMVGLEHWMLDDDDLVRALAEVSWIVTNAAGWDRLQMTGHDREMRTTVVTDGPRPVRAFSRGVQIAVTEPPFIRSVDATGAGDAFAGALAHAVASGMTLERALRRAATAGALATTMRGAQAAQAGQSELLSL